MSEPPEVRGVADARRNPTSTEPESVLSDRTVDDVG